VQKRVIVGIDPGTGISSPTGLAIWDEQTKYVYFCGNLSTKTKKLEHRIKDISDQLEALLLQLEGKLKGEIVFVCIESFVMRGKGGETLQRLIGSFMGRLKYEYHLEHVQNTSVKLRVAGRGDASKELVAEGVLNHFEGADFISTLIKQQEFDILDAFAIGIAGAQTTHVQPKNKKRPKRRTSLLRN
jgi:Holliday junction resolvasome RuvABC endonuclease subunit